MPISDAQRRAIAKHLDKFDDLKIRVPAGERQKYKNFAAQNGFSLNSLVVALLEETLAGSRSLPDKSTPK